MPPVDTHRIVQFIRDPSLQHIELRFSQYSQPAFHRHNHNAYSIGLVSRGSTQFHLLQQAEAVFPVCSGDIVLINPGEVHACNPDADSIFAYTMLYIEPTYMQQLVMDCGQTSKTDFRFPKPVLQNPAIRRIFKSLSQSIIAGSTRLEIETELHETVASILDTCNFEERIFPSCPEAVQKGYLYLQDHLSENISLQELASLCGLSPFHFLRSFRRHYGLPPHTCQLQMRIHHARQMLAAGSPIAETAAAVGFADQSHFTRKFRSLVGATPQQYQAGLST